MTITQRLRREIDYQRGRVFGEVAGAVQDEDEHRGERAIRDAFARLLSVVERCDRCGTAGDCPCP